jgi:hypothetical protein
MRTLVRIWPSSVAVLVALTGGFFLGFHHCGAPALPRELVAIGAALIVATCCIAQFLLTRQASQIVLFGILVLAAYLFGGALGWTWYVSPSSGGEFVREFIHGWQGGC